LSSNFLTPVGSSRDLVAGLGPYLSVGELDCLDNHLRAISTSFWSYADGLRQHHQAYYFQSGRDQFSLPYAADMLGRWLGALRWGLPTGHPISRQPLLAQLTLQFEQFQGDLQRRLSWTEEKPHAASLKCFIEAHEGSEDASDPGIRNFLRLTREMVRLSGTELPIDPVEVYGRYLQWLTFANRADRMMAALSLDLDYRPAGQGPASELA
jgi:hypothetical protein